MRPGQRRIEEVEEYTWGVVWVDGEGIVRDKVKKFVWVRKEEEGECKGGFMRKVGSKKFKVVGRAGSRYVVRELNNKVKEFRLISYCFRGNVNELVKEMRW